MDDRSDLIQITAAPIDSATLIAHVQDAGAGAIDVFLGCTRAETSADGKSLVALDYEAYAEMAQRQLQELVRSARNRWPIVRCAVVHRTGHVKLGEPSVVIAVATPHRAESFEACRFLIDELKKSAAIWKKEIWTGGATSWVAGLTPELH